MHDDVEYNNVNLLVTNFTRLIDIDSKVDGLSARVAHLSEDIKTQIELLKRLKVFEEKIERMWSRLQQMSEESESISTKASIAENSLEIMRNYICGKNSAHSCIKADDK